MPIGGTVKVTTPSDREIAMTRVFNAPRQLVFEALTKPELLKRWFYGPEGWSLDVCEVDLRVGGAFRYVWRHIADNTLMGMGGVYREVSPPERIVATEKFDEPWYPGDAIGTQVLTERDGRTTLTMTILYASKEARDGVLKSPMEHGVRENFDRLERFLGTLSSGVSRTPA